LGDYIHLASSTLRFVIKNREFFITNNEIHEHDTRQVHNFHFPPANSKKYQSGVFYVGVKLYNSLPSYIEEESKNIKKFESLLQKFLLDNTSYSLDEFYNFI
jgi:hypothetical protein